jgi:hypothetical protein
MAGLGKVTALSYGPQDRTHLRLRCLTRRCTRKQADDNALDYMCIAIKILDASATQVLDHNLLVYRSTSTTT